jgi:hypothetical protein
MKYSLYCALLACTIILNSCSKHDAKSLLTANSKNLHGTNRIAGATMLGAPVNEAKVYKLLQGYDHTDDFEASGAYYLDGYVYIACDNMSKIPKIKITLPLNSSDNSLLSTGTPGSGSSNFESITYDNHSTINWYVTAETEKNGSVYQPRIY